MPCLLTVITFFYSILLTSATHTLDYTTYVNLAKQEYNERVHLWNPPPPDGLKPDFRPFQLFDLTQIESVSQELLQVIRKKYPTGNFKWTTVSLTSNKGLKKSYVLLGGSAQRSSTFDTDISVSPREGGTMFLCEFESKLVNENPLGFGSGKNGCRILPPGAKSTSEHEFLGSSSSAITLSDDLSVLAYCDPLWRAQSQVPVGRCFLNTIRNGQVDRSIELSEFCQSGLTVATPCMAGHSVALSSRKTSKPEPDMKRLLENIRLWIGEPLSVPDGRIEIVTDPFGSAVVTTVNRPDPMGNLSFGSHFGFRIVDGVATAPQIFDLSDSHSVNTAQLIGIEKEGRGTRHLNYIDWVGGVNSTDMFTGFGMSMVRITFGKFGQIALVVGAPYHGSPIDTDASNKTLFVNRGRIYLFCPQSTSPTEEAGFILYNDYIDGSANTSFLGFSLTALSKPRADGSVLIAAGAPDLDNRFGYGQVYILRILPDCSFDKVPVQIVQGSLGSLDFGAILPTDGVDIDFNTWSDFVIPTSSEASSSAPTSLYVVAARPVLQAECRFTFPPWLSIRRILTGDSIPITVSVYLSGSDGTGKSEGFIQSVFDDQEARRLVHQIASDWNATSGSAQRFKLQGRPRSNMDRTQKQLSVDFILVAQMDVQDMLDIESPTKGFFVGYRFLQPCPGYSQTIDEDGTCSDGVGIRRPLINWSRCVTLIPLARFVCYPHENCESDVHINVTHQLYTKKSSEEKIHMVQEETSEGSIVQLVDLIYGDADYSEPGLLIKLYNYGPTFAGGVWLELQFYGNLRFSRLQAYETEQDLSVGLDANIRVDVTANETWAACYLDNLPAPDTADVMHRENVPAVWFLKLSTYYPNYTLAGINFTLGAGVTIKVITGTPDPVLRDNVVHVKYRVISDPKLRLSYGPDPVTSRMDNRTKPVFWGSGFQRRVDVDEIGPRVEHTVQVEYMGPTRKLTNVTIRMSVPIALAMSDREGLLDAYVVYIFPEIRASVDGIGGLQWIDLAPKLVAKEGNAGGQRIGVCTVLNSNETLNPLNMIGRDTKTNYLSHKRFESLLTYSRARRQAIPTRGGDAHTQMDFNLQNRSMESTPGDSPEETISFSSTSLFRRIPKEILQCDRVGYRLEQPVCAQIVCHLDELPKNRPVLLTVTGWLWARTFFYKHISDIEVVTTLSVDQGALPDGVVPASEPVGYFHVWQTFFFPQIRPKLIHQIPTWPIIVGVVLGIIFLALLVILLYCVGFFKRRKPDLRKAKFSKGGADELERNSEETPARQTHFAGFQTSTTDKYERGAKRKRRGKHRGELTILHPADLAAGHQTQDEQHLLDDSSGNVNEASPRD
ncbi:hypothetical protein X801_10058 [Opisthorchis viverrini]|uniref:Integrin alpha-2 domain-containing protein n=1 Tax=Opisthorchis viverrini TaxID=6198 RepID=A0A1S8WI91_OPIVI|nr:hypothetical protein X801_10058 [Opisthorchis viverrini]